ncbi:hypothetical protein [Paenibacillus agaridevorans]|uniref:hypothetical protein n=1 Tax=Paenibacillus agaridevorans TaxID=171404 RepID=UPI001BE3DEF1|nr:hypothetical protein [Paenibacillus agaridevorans]
MKKNNLLVLLTAIAVILIGFVGSDNKDGKKNQVGIETDTIGSEINKDIQQITLSKSLAHGLVNADITDDFSDKETIETITQAIYTAAPIPGILNTATPDYDIVLISANSKLAFHLWISETSEQAMIMAVEETHTGYTLSEKSTVKLKEIIFRGY